MDAIRFDFRSPKELGETAELLVDEPLVTLIYINDVEINDIFYPIEVAIRKSEGKEWPKKEKYAHLPPRRFVNAWKHDGPKTPEQEAAFGFFPLACPDCGDSGCGSPYINVTVDKEHVRWSEIEHSCFNWNYNITFTFDRKQYEEALAALNEVSNRKGC